MPDWFHLVKSRLGPLGLGPEREAEIIAELSEHMQEHCENLRKNGLPDEEAVQRSLAGVPDWSGFRQDIRLAEREEGLMNQRIRSIWFPGFCAVGLCYVLTQLIGMLTSTIMANPESFKVKGLIIMAVFSLGLVGTGAGVAYLSKRLGGGVRHHALGVLFPVAAWVVTVLVSLVAFPEHPHMAFDRQLIAMVGTTLAISLPLLTGVLLLGFQSKWSSRAGRDSLLGAIPGKR